MIKESGSRFCYCGMKRISNSIRFGQFSLALAGICGLASAEQGILVVHVSDPQDRPIQNVQLATDGDGSVGGLTDVGGRTRIRLAAQTRAKTWVTLQIIQPQNLVFVSPWDKRVQVPPFENESENFVPVVLIERGNRLALENGQALNAITAKVNQANSIKAGTQAGDLRSDQTSLQDVAREFGLTPDELDRAIRAWGRKVTDPYEKGLAALYEGSYPEASKLLAASLEAREQELQQAQASVADAAFFMGSSLYEQGRYGQAASACRRAMTIRGEDPGVLNCLALSLEGAGDYIGAEPLFRRALDIDEKTLGPDAPFTAIALSNLAALLEEKGDYLGAEPSFRRALTIIEKAWGPDHLATAINLNNLAELLRAKGDYTSAEPLYLRSLAIKDKLYGPNNPYLAAALNNLALLLEDKGDYPGAESLLRRALAIVETARGPEHPETAKCLNNLAATLLAAGEKFAEAQQMLRRALRIDEMALGDAPDTANSLGNLAALLRLQGDYSRAEPLLRRALAIDEKALGPGHPETATCLNGLALLLKAEGDFKGAEPLYRRALAIREKAQGRDHPAIATSLFNLAVLLEYEGDHAGAEPLYRRALAIDEKVFGANDARTQQVRLSLQSVQERLNQPQ